MALSRSLLWHFGQRSFFVSCSLMVSSDAACMPLLCAGLMDRSLRKAGNARRLGATPRRRVGRQFNDAPPEPPDAAIIFAPLGAVVPAALHAVRKGGCVVCGGIHMSDIPSFPYRDSWEERTVCFVANLTRRAGLEFLELAPRIPVQTEAMPFALDQTNESRGRLRSG